MDQASINEQRVILTGYKAQNFETSNLVDQLLGEKEDDLMMGINAIIWIFLSHFTAEDHLVNLSMVRINGKSGNVFKLVSSTKANRAQVYNLKLIEPSVNTVWNHFISMHLVHPDEYDTAGEYILNRSPDWKKYRNAFEICVLHELYTVSEQSKSTTRLPEEEFHQEISQKSLGMAIGLITATIDFVVSCLKAHVQNRVRNPQKPVPKSGIFKQKFIRATGEFPAQKAPSSPPQARQLHTPQPWDHQSSSNK